jgi:hypothetical protein
MYHGCVIWLVACVPNFKINQNYTNYLTVYLQVFFSSLYIDHCDMFLLVEICKTSTCTPYIDRYLLT